MRKLYLKIVVAITVVFGTLGASAQDNKLAAVLVQLKVEKNRIEALQNSHDENKLSILLQDRDMVMQAMINDFTDNFENCPVYYFMDTNYDKVAAKNFEGVLLNADLKPATSLPINSSSTNYLVVQYGRPDIRTKYADKKIDSSAYTHDVIWNVEQAFIVKNADMSFRTMYYRLGESTTRWKKLWDKKYFYCSDDFKMEYFPSAKHFSVHPFMKTPAKMEKY